MQSIHHDLASSIPDSQGQKNNQDSFQNKLEEIDHDLRKYDLSKSLFWGTAADMNKEIIGFEFMSDQVSTLIGPKTIHPYPMYRNQGKSSKNHDGRGL